MQAYTGKAPAKSFWRTGALISPISPSRRLTHALLRDSSAAICARLRLPACLSSSIKAACSRMPRARSRAARNSVTIPAVWSRPREVNGTRAIFSLRAQR